MSFPWLKKKAYGPRLEARGSARSPLPLPAGAAQQDYRFVFFTGASSTLCWPRVRAPGGLASLLRLVEGESWAFDL